MRGKAIGVVFKKELTELLRDKRTIFVIFVLPVILYPLLIVGFTQLSVLMIGKMHEETYRLAVENPDSAPLLMEEIRADTQFTLVETAAPESLLNAGEIHLFLRIPGGFDERIRGGESDSLIVSYDGSDEISDVAKTRMKLLVEGYESELVKGRITAAGLDTSLIKPVLQDYENVATEKEMGGMVFGRVLAMIIVLMLITGAYYTSIDMVAGEKERGTLETLLVSPVGRMEIVVGKYLTVFCLGLLNALLNLGSMGLTLGFGLRMMGGPLGEALQVSISPGVMFISLAMLLPLAALFSALFLAISAFAKSYKEAQGYLTPVFLAAELPAMAALLPGFQISTVTAVIPVLNVTLLIKKIMVGGISPLHVALVFISTTFYAALALRWATKILSDEEALLSESAGSPLSQIFSLRKPRENRGSAGTGDSIFLFALCVALLWWVGAPLQSRNIVTGLLVTEILLVALPPFLLARRLGLDIRKTFRLRGVNISAVLTMAVIAASGFFLITQLQVVFSKIAEIPPKYLQQFEEMLESLKSMGPVGFFCINTFVPAV